MLEIDNLNQNKWKKEYVDILLSFSGGKDSTVLFDLVLKTYKEIRNQFISKIFIVPGYAYEITFPETIKFIKNYVENIRNIDGNDFVKELIFEKPKLPWEKILNDKGFPIYSKQFSVILNRIKKVKSKNGLTNWIFKINTSRFSISYDRLFLLDNDMKKFKIDASIDKQYFGETLKKSNYLYSEKCCDYIKGGLKHIKLPSFVGTMASESNLRKMSWINYGCNIITEKNYVVVHYQFEMKKIFENTSSEIMLKLIKCMDLTKIN